MLKAPCFHRANKDAVSFARNHIPGLLVALLGSAAGLPFVLLWRVADVKQEAALLVSYGVVGPLAVLGALWLYFYLRAVLKVSRLNPHLLIIALGLLIAAWGTAGYLIDRSRGPISWDFQGFLASSWKETGGTYVGSFWVAGKNNDRREIQIEDAYIISKISGDRVAVRLRTRQGYVLSQESNPLPPETRFNMQGLFYDPGVNRQQGEREGMSENEFLKHWGRFSFVVTYRGKEHRYEFSEERIRKQLDLVHPPTTPTPFATKRDL